jgi:hypothetical protein
MIEAGRRHGHYDPRFWSGPLETALPNPTKITSGKVVAHKNGFVAV